MANGNAEEFYEHCVREFESRTELEIAKYCSLRDDFGQIKVSVANLNRFLFTFHIIRALPISETRSSEQHHRIVNAAAARMAAYRDVVSDLLPGDYTSLFASASAVPHLTEQFGCVGHSAIELLLRIANRTIQTLESIRPRGTPCKQVADRFFWYRFTDEGAIDDSCAAEVDLINTVFSSWPEINPPVCKPIDDSTETSGRSNPLPVLSSGVAVISSSEEMIAEVAQSNLDTKVHTGFLGLHLDEATYSLLRVGYPKPVVFQRHKAQWPVIVALVKAEEHGITKDGLHNIDPDRSLAGWRNLRKALCDSLYSIRLKIPEGQYPWKLVHYKIDD